MDLRCRLVSFPRPDESETCYIHLFSPHQKRVRCIVTHSRELRRSSGPASLCPPGKADGPIRQHRELRQDKREHHSRKTPSRGSYSIIVNIIYVDVAIRSKAVKPRDGIQPTTTAPLPERPKASKKDRHNNNEETDQPVPKQSTLANEKSGTAAA